MSDEKPTSEREKKRVVRQGLRKLRNKPGWDVDAFRAGSPQDGLRDLEQKIRGYRAYGDAADCEDCKQLRRDSGDDSALCQRHLAAAMGLDET